MSFKLNSIFVKRQATPIIRYNKKERLLVLNIVSSRISSRHLLETECAMKNPAHLQSL
ncbi:unnamed protein product [Acanthoscelides obtectus]|uniref:Uncharacterized protein n=1 Tax=Acanthoscelides obtectus TaxID=200917 RepID=A0A9P0NXF8_ACAOB|nr:unnamed protein product [Acanthoscelides obtectus]CAK1639114.1 hypothetical protein AOBTE_LOCUS11002 [Acanthoscelides obtectus]